MHDHCTTITRGRTIIAQHCGNVVRWLQFILKGGVVQRRVTSYDLARLSYDILQCLESQPGVEHHKHSQDIGR